MALIAAACAGRADVATALLKAGADIDLAVPGDDGTPPPRSRVTVDEGQRPLHIAVHSLHSETVRLFLDSGADVNAVDHNGITPLISLYRTPPDDDDPGDSKRVAIARQLLEGGAATSVPDNIGYYPVHYAAQHDYTALFDVMLWESPAELNRRSHEGYRYTPLCIAAMVGQAGIVAHLLSRGAHQPAAYDLECSHGCRYVLRCPLKIAV